MTCGAWAGVNRQRRCDRVQNLGDFLGEDPADFFGADFLVEAPVADPLCDRHGRIDTEVGLDQQVFQLLQCGGVELALGEKRGDPAGQRRGGARQASLQPRQPGLRLFRRRGFGRRCLGRGDVGDRCCSSFLCRSFGLGLFRFRPEGRRRIRRRRLVDRGVRRRRLGRCRGVVWFGRWRIRGFGAEQASEEAAFCFAHAIRLPVCRVGSQEGDARYAR
jgi:hypothetical protein